MKKLSYLIPLIIWIILIATLSSQDYHTQSIKPFLKEHFTKEELKERLPDIQFKYNNRKINAQKDPFHFIEFIFRKTAHVVVYAILAICLFIALKIRLANQWKRVGVTLGATLLIAALDEWNQFMSSSRTGSVKDMMIDLIGACLGLMIVILVSAWKERQQK
ncbi:VanZ family protein [Caldalkalibacillus mannanilyticus]|uniref:VanZ family protein n=1 Tax=Caldalkalibacillus mannanilyticus TaxID=1418 RepID=UPI0004694ED6|nr:VanZ family protein [Caldalkalibacillus mannanilyticus]